MNQQSSETMAAINRFRDERHWRPYHNEKDLAMSIAIEAAELMEIYQWRTPEEANSQDLEHIKEEVADVLIYTYMLADNLGLDIDDIIADKLRKNAIKYPAPPTELDGAASEYLLLYLKSHLRRMWWSFSYLFHIRGVNYEL